MAHMSPPVSIAELQTLLNPPSEQERQQIWELILKTGEWIEAMFGPRPAADAMAAIFLHVDRQEAPPDSTWTDAEPGWRDTLWHAALEKLREAGGSETTAEFFSYDDWTFLWREVLAFWADGFGGSLADRFFELLHVYGRSGIIMNMASEIPLRASYEEKVEILDAQIERAKKLLAVLPPNWSEKTSVQDLLRTAVARFHLDKGDKLSPEEIAALGQVDIKTVRNALSLSDDRGLTVDDAGLIGSAEAARWLSRCRGFRASIWPALTSSEEGISLDKSPAAPRTAEYLFVPVAQDKTSFSPKVRQGGKWRVGPKGAEQAFADFYEALDYLNSLTAPYWRRPNAQGNFGIVKGIAWRRVPRAEIEAELFAL